jgi:glutamate/tyrosine decarboxylase-like PLP-dependent enzyme
MRVGAVGPLDDCTILCLQAGNVDTGAFDPAPKLCEAAGRAGAWVHVDGAFGLWAAGSAKYAHLMEGFDQADSWATDAHKYLNVPYDCGVVFCRHGEHLREALQATASYLSQRDGRDPLWHTPELSREGRGVTVWAALRSLGRSGVADLVERTCRYAQKFARDMRAAGFDVLNDVVLNQVLVSFGPAEVTNEVIRRIQADGTCWCGGTVWQDRTAMRLSVSSWATTAEDMAATTDAILRIANSVRTESRS